MALTTRAISALPTTFTAMQNGDWLVGDRAGTPFRITYQNLNASFGLGTIATQAADAVNIDGGAIDGTVIGANTPAAGTFTGATLIGDAPALIFIEQDADDAFEQTYIDAQGGQVRFITRSSTGSVVSIDHTMTKGASGATAFNWETTSGGMTFASGFLTLPNGIIATGGTSSVNRMDPLTNNVGSLGSFSRAYGAMWAFAFSNPSDARLKDNFADPTPKDLAAILRVKFQSFTITEGGHETSGYVAQQIIEAFGGEARPVQLGLIVVDESGFYGVRYELVTALRVEAIARSIA